MDFSILKMRVEMVFETGKSLTEVLEELTRIIEDYEEVQYIKDEQEGKALDDNLVLKSEEVCGACVYSASGKICNTINCRDCPVCDGEGCYCVTIPRGAPCKYFKLNKENKK